VTAALRRHGLAPLEVLAARTVSDRTRRSTGPFGQIDLDLDDDVADGLRIRQAGRGDIAAVARMSLEITGSRIRSSGPLPGWASRSPDMPAMMLSSISSWPAEFLDGGSE